jgi:gliding motility-associated-like protein
MQSKVQRIELYPKTAMTLAVKLPFALLLLTFFSFKSIAQNQSAVRFIKNLGQWNEAIRYRAEIPGGYLVLKNQSLLYVFMDTDSQRRRHAMSVETNSSDVVNGHSVEVFFEGSQVATELVENHENELHFNYFLGNDPSHWASGVPTFGEITYHNIYPNIDLKLYAFRQTVKYEFVVAANADASQIRMKYDGAKAIKLSQNQLQVETSINAFKENKPYTYQEIGNRTQEITTDFRLENNTVTFGFPKGYDKKNTLTIDPELVFSTYSGSLADNWGHTATFDEQGNLYTAGTVHDADAFPLTGGAFQTRFNGQIDIGVLKFNPDGTRLLYGTYIGGAFTDIPHSIIVNNQGDLVIFGTTSSLNFPVLASAFQTRFGGGTAIEPLSGLLMQNGSDTFVARLSASGSRLLACTFVGGAGNDGLSRTADFAIKNYGDEFRGEVVVDDKDNVYVATTTTSSNFPLSRAVQNTNGGRQDVVVYQLDNNLSDLKFSTYLGGAGSDAAYGIKWAASGSVYVSGVTRSVNMPVKANALNRLLNGVEDGFIAKFTNNQLDQLSYLGTSSADAAYLVDVDKDENVHVFGVSEGKYPVSDGVYSNSNSGQFIQTLDKTLSKSVFSTVFGSGRGRPDISPTALDVNECGNIYLSGWGGTVNTKNGYNSASSTAGLPVTSDAYRKTTSGNNFYIGIFEKSAKSLLYGTFFGSTGVAVENERGDHVDGGTSRFSKSGVIYHATCACDKGSAFPTTPNAWSKTNSSLNCNNAAFKFDVDAFKASFDVFDGTKKDIVQGCAPLTLDFLNTSLGGKTYTWDIQGNVISRDATGSKYTFTQPGEYKVTLKIFNPLICRGQDVATKTIKITTSKAKAAGDTTVCSDIPVQLRAEGGLKYVWSPAAGLSNANIANPIAKVKTTTVFTVQIADSNCTVSRTVTVKINDAKIDLEVFRDTTICPGRTAQLSVKSGALKYKWSISTADSSKANIVVKPLITTTYTVVAQYADGCRSSKSVIVKVEDNKPDFKVSRDTTICEGQAVQLLAQGGVNYVWSPSNTLSDSTVKNPIAKPKQTTTYSVMSLYPDGCSPKRSITVAIERPPQGVNFDTELSYNCGLPTKIKLQNRTNGATRYEWLLGDGNGSKNTNPNLYSYDKNGTYQVTLKAYSARGCETVSTQNLNVLNLSDIPNVITPNGDGKNDVFRIGIPNSKLEIVNRYGRRLYLSDNYTDDWGLGIENGTYYYSLTLQGGQQCKGWIQILN